MAQHSASTASIVNALTNLPLNAQYQQLATTKNYAPLAANIAGNGGIVVAGVESILSTMERTAASELPQAVTLQQADVSSKIATAANNRATTAANMNVLVSSLSTNINTRFDAANNVRLSISAVMSSARSAILAQGTADYNTQITNENSRAIAEAATLNTNVNSISTATSTNLVNAITTESSRADAFCTTASSNGGSSIGLQTGTTNDHTTWYALVVICLAFRVIALLVLVLGAPTSLSSQAGLVYFSGGNKTLFVCCEFP